MKSLVILAAGMGSRFGGLKQITPLGPNGEFIIDYSIYDAIRVGFDRVVFIIKEENYDIFKSTIGSRVEDKIEVKYAFQKMDVEGIPSTRVKPLGTAHAIMCAKEYIDGPFMIINADDYYGYDAFKQGIEYLNKMEDSTYGLVGYKVCNTITENGEVKRGICEIDNGYLTDIVESKVGRVEKGISMTPLAGGDTVIISEDTPVSMNMLLFNESLFDYLEKDLKEFVDNIKDIEKDEYLIPDVLDKHIKNGDIKVKVIPTTATWYGVTYKEDTDYVKDSLAKLHKDGTYSSKLW
ncbi:MAG: NTP transferase domain-containing protein [Bacilli bacterium]|nr:NTP transferase domain-containing protein [Bacilli bacterium]